MCEAISKIARNCLAYMLDFIVMQMSKVNRVVNILFSKARFLRRISAVSMQLQQKLMSKSSHYLLSQLHSTRQKRDV